MCIPTPDTPEAPLVPKAPPPPEPLAKELSNPEAEGVDKFGMVWPNVWAFYNGGYKYWESEDAQTYADDFVKKIRVFNKLGIL